MKKNGIPSKASFKYYFNLVCPEFRRNILTSLNVPWINNKVITARTKLRNLYNLYT
jgi:hypothetical protein